MYRGEVYIHAARPELSTPVSNHEDGAVLLGLAAMQLLCIFARG
jgi:hypothetical protein